MAFSMNWSNEELKGQPPVPAGTYTLQFNTFRPKASKDGGSVNLNAEFTIIGNPEYENRKVFASLNSKAGFIITDFVHSAGLPMEVVQDEFVGTAKQNYTIPGAFPEMETSPEDPAQWKYVGPLTNATLSVELAITSYQGKERNEIRQFLCGINGCTERHSTNLIRG